MMHVDLATDALRAGSVDMLEAGLRRTLSEHHGDDPRDVMLDLAPFHDAARRLGSVPADVFDRAATGVAEDMVRLATAFGRRGDVTVGAFGWRLVEEPDGPRYVFGARGRPRVAAASQRSAAAQGSTAPQSSTDPEFTAPRARPFRFLAELGPVTDVRTLSERARRAESIGYSTLVQPDHLLDLLAPIPSLAVVLAATDGLRVAAFVLNNDLRHPAVLAQDLATLDVLGSGRLDVALGAGWNKREYDAVGLTFDPVPVRVERLEESIRVMKGAFGEAPFTFHGRHYRIENYDGRPKPIQRPHPPFFIGGGGRRTLELAAREADIVGLAPRVRRDGRGDPSSATLSATEEKIAWVRAAAGDRFERLELNVYPSMWPVTVTDDARGVARQAIDRLRSRTGVELTEAEILESPHLFIGSIDTLVGKFRALRERLGINSFMVGGIEQLAAVVERLAGT